MPITHSPDRVSACGGADTMNSTVCTICSDNFLTNAEKVETACKHSFHLSCIRTWLDSNQTCPVCRQTCSPSDLKTVVDTSTRGTGAVPRERPNTRRQGQGNPHPRTASASTHALGQSQSPRNPRRTAVNQAGNVNERRVLELINQSLGDFRHEITNTITNEMQTLMRNMTLNRGRTPSPVQLRQEEAVEWPREVPYEERNSRRLFTSQRRTESLGIGNITLANEKISNLIRNWQIRFNGSTDTMTTDQFIYRINTLTSLHLNGNFEVLCKHIHSIFDGKALKWFWRYRQHVDNLEWFELCDALRRQFKDYSTDSEIRDEIRRRKQKPTELFDDFFDAVMMLSDRLRFQMSESELVEILLRNLKSDLRHELLHLDIQDIHTLRKEVRKHEKFWRDLNAYAPRQNPARKQFYEVTHNLEDTREENADVEVITTDIDAIAISSLKCWNCEEIGHRYHDCLKDRRIFCYGCGEVNTYKPNCAKCNNPSENRTRDVRRKSDGRPSNPPRN